MGVGVDPSGSCHLEGSVIPPPHTPTPTPPLTLPRSLWHTSTAALGPVCMHHLAAAPCLLVPVPCRVQCRVPCVHMHCFMGPEATSGTRRIATVNVSGIAPRPVSGSSSPACSTLLEACMSRTGSRAGGGQRLGPRPPRTGYPLPAGSCEGCLAAATGRSTCGIILGAGLPPTLPAPPYLAASRRGSAGGTRYPLPTPPGPAARVHHHFAPTSSSRTCGIPEVLHLLSTPPSASLRFACSLRARGGWATAH